MSKFYLYLFIGLVVFYWGADFTLLGISISVIYNRWME